MQEAELAPFSALDGGWSGRIVRWCAGVRRFLVVRGEMLLWQHGVRVGGFSVR